ncbi:MAG TPA: hypothetical protein VGG84_07885 [Gemmatimonadaceae bacterium]|jgi:hypothetical protein
MQNRDRITDSTDGRIERAKGAALGKHDDHPSVADEVGEAAGGISGVLAGAAIGSVGGPVGTLIGGIAGALGGWWTGRAITEAVSQLTHEDDEYYRSAYMDSPNQLADRAYDDIRPAYHLGHVAAYNPDYQNKNWSDVEQELQRGWGSEQSRRYGSWTTVSGYASEGFERGRSLADREREAATRNLDQVSGQTGRTDDR